MQILSQLTRHIVVDDRLDPFDIQAAGSQICCHKEVGLSVPKLLKRFQALESIPLSVHCQQNIRARTHLFLREVAVQFLA